MLLALVQVRKQHITRITNHSELEADGSDTHLDDAIVVLRLCVLVVPGVLDVVDGRVGILLERLRVLLDNGQVVLERRQAVVAQLVGARKIGLYVGVGSAQVGVQRLDERLVRGVGEVQRALAVRVRLECLEAVVHNGVRRQVLRRVRWNGRRTSRDGRRTDKTFELGVSPLVRGASLFPMLLSPVA